MPADAADAHDMPGDSADDVADADLAPADNPLSGMLAQVQAMQREMAEAQQALADAVVEGTAGGGLVTATVTGSGELRAVRIAPEVVDPDDVEMLEDLVAAAVGDALRKAHELQSQQLGSATSGLDIGSLTEGLGLGGLFG